ncbi:hypothetical protein DPMN_095838 [Dreissena polymorpha]|uniref:Uncharacterized protein n=1 Tax=Dreissena polymorpha TaxID=45954 RepID=A0A9D4LA91_DREPO|nr:hypothetical protein DPMN_095838 [Dreissena polymorpha]
MIENSKVAHLRYKENDLFCSAPDIIITNVLTKFHEDVLTKGFSHLWTAFPPPRGRVFQQTGTIFELIQDKSNDLTKTNVLRPGGHFHEDRTIYVASILPYPVETLLLQKHQTIVLTRKNAPPPGGHVFQASGNILELVQAIIRKHLLTKCHDDRTINLASRVLTRKKDPLPDGHVFQQTRTNFDLIQDIIRINCQQENAPSPDGHVFQPTEIIFELVQNIIGTNLLTAFHDDRTINVASIELTNVNKANIVVARRTTNDEQDAITKVHQEHIVLS